MTGAAPLKSVAIAAPVTCPERSAACPPRTPAPSPAAYSPGTLVRPNASISGRQPPRARSKTHSARSSRRSSVAGARPWPTQSASASIRTAAATDRWRTSLSAEAISTASRRSSPSVRATFARNRMGTPARISRSTQPAPCAASRGRRARSGAAASQSAGPLRSTTAATSAPAFNTPAATAANSGPAPATTTRRPGEMRWVFSIVVAAARPNTPGVVHPGNGRTRSTVPVAISSAVASTACGASGPIASRRNPRATGMTDQTRQPNPVCAPEPSRSRRSASPARRSGSESPESEWVGNRAPGVLR